jgi:RNA polymerase sigma-70 factor, ECF subfamily
MNGVDNIAMNDDEDLIRRAQSDTGAGAEAFGTLYDKYITKIYAFVYRRIEDVAAAQDVTSATFEAALRHLPSYRWRGISFSAWLYKIARREVAQHYRRMQYKVPTPETSPPDPESHVQTIERDLALNNALAQLSEKDRELLTLRYLDDLPVSDVAAILGISAQNVYLRTHRALARLREQMEQSTAQPIDKPAE